MWSEKYYCQYVQILLAISPFRGWILKTPNSYFISTSSEINKKWRIVISYLLVYLWTSSHPETRCLCDNIINPVILSLPSSRSTICVRAFYQSTYMSVIQKKSMLVTFVQHMRCRNSNIKKSGTTLSRPGALHTLGTCGPIQYRALLNIFNFLWQFIIKYNSVYCFLTLSPFWIMEISSSFCILN